MNDPNKTGENPAETAAPASNPVSAQPAMRSESLAGSVPRVVSEAENRDTGLFPSISLERLNRRVLIGGMFVMALVLAFMMRYFLVPVILAAAFATLFHPLYIWFRSLARGNRAVGSFASCILLIACFLVPAYFLGNQVVKQTTEVYHSADEQVQKLSLRIDNGAIGALLRQPIIASLPFEEEIDIRALIDEGFRSAAKHFSGWISKTSRGVASLLINVFIMFFTLFYFFMDGERLITRIRYLSPLRYEYEDMIIKRFLLVSRAVVKGTILVAFIQSSIGALTLLIFGVHSWVLWWFVMFMLSIIPLCGCWIVLIPAAVIQVLLGNTGQGIGIFLVSVLVVSNIDNILRPRLVGSEAKMHDLIIFFSILGGIVTFGVLGFIVGPVLAALFVTLLEMYSAEYKSQLDAGNTATQQMPVVPRDQTPP